jgi:hypothetical protein
MDLYVANATQQVYTFWYRVPEGRAPLHASIPNGGQVKLPSPPGGFNRQQADVVIAQLAKAGGASVDEVRAGRKRYWLMWSEKPIPLTPIYTVIEQNQNLLKIEGEKLRKEAAIAIDSQVQSLGDTHRFQPPDALEMSMVEQESKDNPSPSFGEGLRVSRTEQPGEPPRSGRRSKRAA